MTKHIKDHIDGLNNDKLISMLDDIIDTISKIKLSGDDTRVYDYYDKCEQERKYLYSKLYEYKSL